MATRTIEVGYLGRVEGEGGLRLKIRDRKVTEAELRIFEPPRFFEAFLRGREHAEVPDIVARICGICPVAYQMSAVQAIEDAFGIRVSDQVRALRRLLYCGEWLESHLLHVFMLHAPDFLGYASAIEMAAEHRPIVERALKMKKAGNEIVRVLGGREIHPINVRVGGFYRAPARSELRAMREPLDWARDAAVESLRWASGLDYPDFERDYEFVALRHELEYPMYEGRIASSSGLDIDASRYEQHFEESHVAHSTALHSHIRGRGPYFVGPLARLNLNARTLSPVAREALVDSGLALPCRNPFRSLQARLIEAVHAFDTALSLIETYEPPEPASSEVVARAATGFGATEAPRGLLWHSYEIDDEGIVRDARIVPPTSQNQPTIEADLRAFAEAFVDLPDDALRTRCEQSIRNYDPCISCSTHFLRLEIDRGEPAPAARGAQPRIVVIALGNPMRGDDGVGPEVARRLRERLDPGVQIRTGLNDAMAILDAWHEADAVFVVDAAASGAPPGRLHRVPLDDRLLPDALARCSSHGSGLAEAVRMARALGRLPARLVCHAIEGEGFATGEPLSGAVAASIGPLVDALARDIESAVAELRRSPR